MRKKTIKKAVAKNDKLKQELRELRKDLIKLKKSKRRMQLLWYRTKKEHVARIKDLDKRLKALKRKTSARKPAAGKQTRKKRK